MVIQSHAENEGDDMDGFDFGQQDAEPVQVGPADQESGDEGIRPAAFNDLFSQASMRPLSPPFSPLRTPAVPLQSPDFSLSQPHAADDEQSPSIILFRSQSRSP